MLPRRITISLLSEFADRAPLLSRTPTAKCNTITSKDFIASSSVAIDCKKVADLYQVGGQQSRYSLPAVSSQIFNCKVPLLIIHLVN